MPDDPSKRGPVDRNSVDVKDDYELRYWTAHFGVTAAELKRAVQVVGPVARDVEILLSRKRG